MNAQSAGDFPQITNSSYGANTQWLGTLTADGVTQWEQDDSPNLLRGLKQRSPLGKAAEDVLDLTTSILFQHQQNQTNMSTRRIVKVFIADPHPDVPMDKALLHKGDEKWTDSTNEELYFEIPINDLLKTHNAERVKWLDKEATRKAGKDIYLEPVRIRDLKMVVVEIAKF